MPTENEVSNAESILRAEYYQSVRAYADEIRAAIERKEIESADKVFDYLHQQVDSSEWVIYTHNAAKVCLLSDNDDALFEEVGELPIARCAADIYTALAYWALRADILDALGDVYGMFDPADDL